MNECALNTCRRHRSRVARKTYCVLCCFTVQEKQAIIKVTDNDGNELVWKAVASYLWMNVHPYRVDFYYIIATDLEIVWL